MYTLSKLTQLTLLLTLLTTSLNGQESVNDENYNSAYMESYHAVHWSIYIPLGIYAAAAIFLGIADTKHDESFSHSRSDALGPMSDYSSRSFHSH